MLEALWRSITYKKMSMLLLQVIVIELSVQSECVMLNFGRGF